MSAGSEEHLRSHAFLATSEDAILGMLQVIYTPSDWYLRVAGEIARVYQGNASASMTLPIKPPKSAAR